MQPLVTGETAEEEKKQHKGKSGSLVNTFPLVQLKAGLLYIDEAKASPT